MSRELIVQKTDQAIAAMRKLDIDCWLTFVRETVMMSDPIMPYISGIGVVGASALILTADGRKIAILVSFDTSQFVEQGVYDEIVPYVSSIREPLRKILTELDPEKIALNFSSDDVAADGLTFGMYNMLNDLLADTPYMQRFVSADPIISAVRGIKSPEERELIREATLETLDIFKTFEERLRDNGLDGWTTDGAAKFLQEETEKRGLGFSWDKSCDPSVTSGPIDAIGHGTPTGVPLLPGHALRADFGIIKDGYSSDLQRTWYLLDDDEACVPDEVQSAFDVVLKGIRAAKDFLRPGVAGWEVDAVARKIVTENGFEEYNHSLGHQIGRLAHDGGGGLSPRWERNGSKPYEIVRAGQVYTLEFGLPTPRGWVSLEEMVFVTDDACEYVVPPQERITTLGPWQKK